MSCGGEEVPANTDRMKRPVLIFGVVVAAGIAISILAYSIQRSWLWYKKPMKKKVAKRKKAGKGKVCCVC